MTKKKTGAGAERDTRRFVQVARSPSIGVETGHGRPWVGVDQQVGHGSADALYLLDDDHYVEALSLGSTLQPYVKECWEGRHPDRRVFEPAGGAWRPEHWVPARQRILPPVFEGELWHHMDALGESEGSERGTTSRLLAAHTAEVVAADGRIRSMSFRLRGEGAYPRPAALIGGLGPGSPRGDTDAVLGDPTDVPDVFVVESVRVRLGYDAVGLAEIAIEGLTSGQVLPEAGIGVILAAVGGPEEGDAYRAMTEVIGGEPHYWASSGYPGRRLTDIAGAAEIQVDGGEVVSIRVAPGRASGAELFPQGSLAREVVHGALGPPLSTSGNVDFYRYGNRDLLLEYGLGDSARSVLAVRSGETPSDRFFRWRAGWFVRFVALLGRGQTDPLVEWARSITGVRVGMRGGAVSDVELGASAGPARFALFLEGTPPDPTPSDIRFGTPLFLDGSDAVWDLGTSVVHARLGRDGRITTIAVRQEMPRSLRR